MKSLDLTQTDRFDTDANPDVPGHVCIIMDGNHRWAKKRHLPGAAGHRAGAKRVRQIARACASIGVQHLTLFAFSTENWLRPEGEVSLLMDIMRHVMADDIEELHQHEVRVRVIGDKSRFAPDIRDKMIECETMTQDNRKLNLSVALNYGGRWDIVEAAKRFASQVAQGEAAPEDLSEEGFARLMSLGDLPDPDLLVRTGGEHRVSNFLLWDMAYTEMYFTDTFWPDFDDACLAQAVAEYASRARRYGQRS